MLRISAWTVSFAAHAALALPFVLTAAEPRTNAIEAGSGDDAIRIEMGLPMEGIASSGEDAMTVAAVETPATEAIAARPELEAVEAVEPPVEDTPPPELETVEEPVPELSDLIVAEAEPTEDSVAPPPLEEIKQPPPVEELPKPQLEQVATAAQLARVAVQEQVAAGAQKDGGEVEAKAIQEYMGDMYRYIQGFRVYPKSKKNGRKRTGEVMVAVTLNSDGSVSDRRVTASSGDRFVDRAALKWIDKAAPFPALPREASVSPIVIEVPFNFTVQ